MAKATERPTTIPSRRALLAGAPAVAAAALATGILANAAAIGMAKAGEVDPIHAAIDLHREAVRIHEEAREHSRELAANDEPKSRGQRVSAPRALAHARWNAAADVVMEVTDRLLGTQPATFDGAVAALEYSVEFMEITTGNDDYDFLSFDCHSEFVGNIATALRKIIRSKDNNTIA